MHKALISSLLFGAMAITSFSAQAILVKPCLDENQSTCIIETTLSSSKVGFSIENSQQERIFAFGVSNEDPGGNSYSDHIGWEGQYVDKKGWDAGHYTFRFYETVQVPDSQKSFERTVMTWRSGEQSINIPQIPKPRPIQEQPQEDTLSITAELHDGPIEQGPQQGYLGSFESRFGTEDYYASFFWNENVDNSQLTNGVTLSYNFTEDIDFNSEFSTFGANIDPDNGAVGVITSSVNAVPEPETYAMFLVGLGMLGFTARRRKQQS